MILNNQIIEFKGMPLFQKARFKAPYVMEGAIQEFACFFYMVEGTMLTYDTRGISKLSEKEAIVKNCNNYVQRYLQRGGSGECEAIAIYLYPDLLREIYKDEVPSFLLEDRVPSPKKFVNNRLVEQYMVNLSIYFEEPDLLDDELGILKLKELMMILLKSNDSTSIRRLLSEIFTPVNIEFREAIERNMFNNLTLDQLAFICKMSLSTFKREFKRTFNDTPARYMKRRKLEHAASLLLCGEGPIGDIAYEAGFHDVTTFSAIFHQKYQTSPSKYRLNHKRK